MKSKSLAVSLLVFLLFSCSSIKTLDETSKINLHNNYNKVSFIFKANYAIPTSSLFQPRFLTSEYEVKISNDTLISHLPYFGEAYYSAYGSNESPLSFVSKNFNYTEKRNDKKNRTNITIQISDQRFPIVYYFSIFDNGRADLTVADSSRKKIVFQGNIINTSK